MQEPTIRREDRRTTAEAPALDPTLLRFSDAERKFLLSAIDEDEEKMREKVVEIQSEAYEEYPYPCIRMFHFVSQMMAENPAYASVVEAGKKGDTLFLDIGCHMGTDVRRLAYDGYPREHILACDLRDVYIKLGYRLFRDSPEMNPIRFFTADIFSVSLSAENSAPSPDTCLQRVENLDELRRRLDYIYAGALFHLFDEETQLAIALRMGTLLKRAPGAIIFGRHQGKEEAGLIADHMSRVRYGHSPQSWTTMWTTAFERLEGKEWAAEHVRVDASLKQREFALGGSQSTHRHEQLDWAVRIV